MIKQALPRLLLQWNLVNNPDIKHGKSEIGFTPDEEIGRGAHHFDVAKFGADWAYTMDGSQIGELEYGILMRLERKLLQRKSVHPGYAKGKMINSMLIANDFINELPAGETPEETKDMKVSFMYHLTGSIEETVLELIIRDHNKKNLRNAKN
jgi:tripeptide aminopeptidase